MKILWVWQCITFIKIVCTCGSMKFRRAKQAKLYEKIIIWTIHSVDESKRRGRRKWLWKCDFFKFRRKTWATHCALSGGSSFKWRFWNSKEVFHKSLDQPARSGNVSPSNCKALKLITIYYDIQQSQKRKAKNKHFYQIDGKNNTKLSKEKEKTPNWI